MLHCALQGLQNWPKSANDWSLRLVWFKMKQLLERKANNIRFFMLVAIMFKFLKRRQPGAGNTKFLDVLEVAIT